MAPQKAITWSALDFCTSPATGDIQKIGVHMPQPINPAVKLLQIHTVSVYITAHQMYYLFGAL
jgi:hypothetical protein